MSGFRNYILQMIDCLIKCSHNSLTKSVTAQSFWSFHLKRPWCCWTAPLWNVSWSGWLWRFGNPFKLIFSLQRQSWCPKLEIPPVLCNSSTSFFLRKFLPPDYAFSVVDSDNHNIVHFLCKKNNPDASCPIPGALESLFLKEFLAGDFASPVFGDNHSITRALLLSSLAAQTPAFLTREVPGINCETQPRGWVVRYQMSYSRKDSPRILLASFAFLFKREFQRIFYKLANSTSLNQDTKSPLPVYKISQQIPLKDQSAHKDKLNQKAVTSVKKIQIY